MLINKRVKQFFSNWVYPDVAVFAFCIFLLIGVWGGTYWQMELDKRAMETLFKKWSRQ